ncbi:hypothetical protein LBMAG20_11000 [Methylocystaceae bacterium]|nr:hypothetical protein LBMAG20_11000 [Methylocystaceae bacterium]
MRKSVETALMRILNDATYRKEVIKWIASHSQADLNTHQICWYGKKDAHHMPIMNICSDNAPVTVAVETILYVIDNHKLPKEEQILLLK